MIIFNKAGGGKIAILASSIVTMEQEDDDEVKITMAVDGNFSDVHVVADLGEIVKAIEA